MGSRCRESACKIVYLFDMSIFYISILISFNLFQFEAACPTSWTELGDSCYHVSQGAMNWIDSQVYCWGKGAYLAEIMSKEEETLLDSFLIDGTCYWLGLT